MGVASLLRVLSTASLAAGALQGHGFLGGASGGAAAWAPADGAASARQLLATENADGMSTGMIVGFSIISVILVAVSGLMAGLVLGLLSLDKVDLEVAKRSGTERQKWLVSRVEPFAEQPHYTMCALVVVNAACNTALPLFIDRLLNPLAAILISVTAILVFAEIMPQALCKRYGLEIGAYCSWIVRLLMWITFPVSWPLGKLLDWLLGEESALFRRQELKALVGIHAETQQDGSVGALTSDEVQVIQGALDLANKTAEAVMTPLGKVLMVSNEAVIDRALVERVVAAGHSRLPVYEGENKQAIIGLVLVKELGLVDETAGTRINELRLREMPFLRADVPLYDVLKIFRFGRKHMACLTKVSTDPSAGKASPMRLPMFRRTSPFAAPGEQQVEEVVGIITIEDVLEELLQQEIVDETDQYEDNLQTVHVAPQVPLVKDLPPSLRRFLSPRRSMRSSEFALAAEGQRSVEVARLSGISSVSDGGQSGHAAQNGGLMGRQGSGGSGALVGANGHATAAQAAVHGSPPRGQQRSGSRSSLATHSRSISHTSLGAAAAANVLMVAGGPGGADAEAVAAGVTAGIRAAELQHGGGGPAMRPPLPRSSLAGRSRSAELVRGGGSGRGTPDLGPGSYLGGRPLTPDAYTSTSPRAPADRAAAPGDPAAVRGGSSGGEHVTIELGEVSLATTEDGSEDASAARPLVKPGKFGS